MDKKDGGTIDLESLREVRDYFADRQDAEQLAGESFPTPNEEMRLLVTVDSVLAELTARRARDAEVEALVAAAKRTTDAFCALGESTPFTRYADRCLHECEQSMVALDAARTAAHDAPDKCFCDRMYPDSNPNASCGDCPTRDYAPKPPSIPEPSEEDVDVACEALDFDNDVFAHMRERVQGVLATYTARLRERIGGGA